MTNARKDKLKHVKIEEIHILERYRDDMGDIEELKESIQEKGILQPITLDSDMNLLAGCRRYTAAKSLGLTTIPALIREIDGEVDSREVELIENVHRKNFTWSEEAALIAEIDRLYKEKDQNWSSRKTAKLLDQSVGGISQKIKLANAIEKVPELGDCKTADEANKLINSIHENAIIEEQRRRQKEAMSEPDLPPEGESAEQKSIRMDASIKRALQLADSNYIIGDTLKAIKSMNPNGHVDFIECDPPYGIDLNTQKMAKGRNTAATYNEVPRDKYVDFLKELCTGLYNAAGKDCWMVFWYGPTWHTDVMAALRDAGWNVDDIPCVWVKGSGQTMQPDHHLARAYEPFLMCKKGKPVLVKRGRTNVFFFSPCPPTGKDAKYHPTQRPVTLIEEILNTFISGRSHIFVPFLGSGATLRAAYNLGHQAYGFDISDEYKDKFMLAVENDCRKLLSSDDED